MRLSVIFLASAGTQLLGIRISPFHEWDQSNVSGSFDGSGQFPLVDGTVTGHFSGEYLTALGHIPAEDFDVLILYKRNLIGAKSAKLSSLKSFRLHYSISSRIFSNKKLKGFDIRNFIGHISFTRPGSTLLMAVLLRQEPDRVGHNFHFALLLALVLPSSFAQPTFDEATPALAEVLTTGLRLLAENDCIDEKGLFLPVIAGFKLRVHSDGDRSDRSSSGRISDLGVLGKIAYENNSVEHQSPSLISAGA